IHSTYFVGNSYPGRFKNSQVDAYYNAPVSALSMDQNLLTLVVKPGPVAGSPAQVELSPPLDGFPLQNQVLTQGKKARILIRNRRQTPEDELVLLRGQIPLGAEPQVFQLAQTDPVAYTTRRLVQALKKFGINCPSNPQVNSTPPSSTILYENLSIPLGQIIHEANKNSNNFVTEQVIKTLGALASGQAGTTALGIEVLKKNLKKIGIPPDEINLENGSGLSKNNRLTVQTLAKVLTQAYRDPYLQADFLSSLSVLGVDGTLKDKFFDKGLEWQFRGKTGTMSGVTSLSGFIIPNSGGKVLALAFIANGNGPGFWKQMEFQQKLLELLIQS
ncbi:MAG: D-alanyl-D-alanine carboxypeptidase/D-alanyl-D-alanine-endopeptidase, partial [bacterium]|nr:D-alanyl-D-alanine carboxypeptidase/D-alanyl-D-alanine-endopeptidase [bacterium]